MDYWITLNGLGDYFEASLPNCNYCSSTCVVVPQRPHFWSKWDVQNNVWNSSDELKILALRAERNKLLELTDKLMISDYLALFSPEDQNIIKTYRSDLRNFSTVPPYDLPECPVLLASLI